MTNKYQAMTNLLIVELQLWPLSENVTLPTDKKYLTLRDAQRLANFASQK